GNTQVSITSPLQSTTENQIQQLFASSIVDVVATR
ncbi:hypothetical protein L914_14982, partial [Phytophthora nicotianae]